MLDFEEWADLAAQLLKRTGEEQAGILAARKVDPEAWRAADLRYNALLVDDVVEDRMDRRATYGRKCAAEMARRKGEKRTTIASDATSAPASDAGPPAAAAAEHPRAPEQANHNGGGVLAPKVAPGVPVSARGMGDSAGTVEFFDLATFLKPRPESALPFKESSSLQGKFGASTAKVRQGDGSSGETVEVDGALVARVLASHHPQGAPHTPSTRILSIESYASLCAELSVHPDRETQVKARYGLSDDGWRQVEAHWRARLAAIDSERRRWEELFGNYREWVLRHQR